MLKDDAVQTVRRTSSTAALCALPSLAIRWPSLSRLPSARDLPRIGLPQEMEIPPVPETSNAQLKCDLVGSIPHLRAFAISLSGNADRADDLVQETLAQGLEETRFVRRRQQPESMAVHDPAKHLLFSQYRKRRREVQDIDGIFANMITVAPRQDDHMDLLDIRIALAQLPADQREAFILVGAAGRSYDEAANICGCAIGTIKSRVSRARQRLAYMLSPIGDPEACLAAMRRLQSSGRGARGPLGSRPRAATPQVGIIPTPNQPPDMKQACRLFAAR